METRVVAKALLFRADGTFLAVHRSPDDDHRPNEWDLPGGGIERGEEPTSGLLREIEEEVGVRLTASEVQIVWTTTQQRDQRNIIRLFYVGVMPSQAGVQLSDEHHDATWMTLQQGIEQYEPPLYKTLFQYILDNHLTPLAS